MEDVTELLGGAGNDSGVKSEEQTAKRANDGGFDKVTIQTRSPGANALFQVNKVIREWG